MAISASLEKMTITAYSDGTFKTPNTDVAPYSAYINPASYNHDYSIIYNDVQAQGSPGSSPKFNRVGSEKISFDLVFDGTGVVPSPIPGVMPFTEDGITTQVAKFKDVVFDFNGDIHSPNFVQILWGTLVFNCRLTTMNFKYTLFKPDGTPLRANAAVSFTEYTDEVKLESEAGKESPDMSHLITVLAGDTLPLMCYRVYGSSHHYLAVARINQLTDFRSLVVGNQLLFPPLRDQIA
jgi:hypothetical protein